MNTLRNYRVVLAIMVLVAMGAAAAQIKKGQSQPMETKYWMKGVMKPAGDALKEGLNSAPADEEAWEVLAMHAALLNEASYVLMADGRCPDDVWANASTETLRQGTADLIRAIDSRDFPAARAAFRAAARSCKGCHDAHKPKDE